MFHAPAACANCGKKRKRLGEAADRKGFSKKEDEIWLEVMYINMKYDLAIFSNIDNNKSNMT